MISENLSLTNVTLTFYQLTDLNTYLVDLQGAVQLAHLRDHIPAFMVQEQEQDFREIFDEVSQTPGQCCLYTNHWGLSYLSRSLCGEDHKDRALVIGPFFIQIPEPHTNASIDQKEQMELEAFFRNLKLINSSKMHSLANVLDQAGSIRQAPLRFTVAAAPPVSQGSPRTNSQQIIGQTDEELHHLIDVRYEVEKELMHAIEYGDITMFRKVFENTGTLFDFSERFPGQPVRTLKNALVILNTLFRTAALRGKVQPLLLHQISERFAKKIERSETIQALNHLMQVMAEEYCELVRSRSTSGHSPVVQKAMKYMTVNYSKPLGLQQLAEACLVHPAHLSRQFKKETGVTLTDFHQKQRIDEAKALLRTSQVSIAWIAGCVGFDSSGYFTRVFQKLEGMSPTEYRKKH